MRAILITGFQRSGTTLLRKIFQRHPSVYTMFHEESILNKMFRINNFIHKLDSDTIWGEKIPYYGNSILKYVKKWVNKFDDYRIIHIVRHPYDVIESNNRTFGFDYDLTAKYYNKFVYQTLCKLDSDKFVEHIKFEDLVLHQEYMIGYLFNFCGLDFNDKIYKQIKSTDFKYFKDINQDRAFATNENLSNIRFTKITTLLNNKIDSPVLYSE